MSKPYIHAQSSAKKFGGVAEDYLPIHQLMDSSKEHIGDNRHRALMHNTWGCFMIERVFGVVAKNSEGKECSPRDVAEMHCIEDLGVIPTVADWLSKMPIVSDKELKEESTSGSALEAFKKAQEVMNTHLLAASKEFGKFLISEFEKFPADKVNRIEWTQGTPGFNDGDPCVFGVHDFNAYPHRNNEDYDDEFQIPRNAKPDLSSDSWVMKYCNGLYFPHEIDDALFLKAFGDGKKIIWKRGNKTLKVEDYDCD
jgi:hypothetical protein